MKKSLSALLNRLEKTRSTYWNITRETGVLLNSLIRTRNYRSAFEIGTSNGYSGLWLAEALTHTKGRLTTMESNRERFFLAEKTFEKSGLKNITQILGHAPEAIPHSSKKFDLIFLDATKYEHPLYLKALLPRLKKGGMIITDNATSHKSELKEFFAKTKKLNPILLPLGHGLLVIHS